MDLFKWFKPGFEALGLILGLLGGPFWGQWGLGPFLPVQVALSIGPILGLAGELIGHKLNNALTVYILHPSIYISTNTQLKQ